MSTRPTSPPPSTNVTVVRVYEQDVPGAAKALLALLQPPRQQDGNLPFDAKHLRQQPIAARDASGEG
jgi:hypothetical protein